VGSLVRRLPTAVRCGSHLACVLPVTVARRGSRGVCPATRRQLASELVTEVAVIDKKIKAANAHLTGLVDVTGSTLQRLHGIGPSGAARLLGDIGDIDRFANRDHFASWNGTAPIDASSGDQHRHRPSRAGNRRINRVLHIMAVVQLRNDTEGRAYYRRNYGGGHTPAELAARAEHVSAAYRAVQRDASPPPREITANGQPVTNIQRITHDLGPRMIANQLAAARARRGSAPNGTTFSDRVAGPGSWPDLA
jgi:hypothetical protein